MTNHFLREIKLVDDDIVQIEVGNCVIHIAAERFNFNGPGCTINIMRGDKDKPCYYHITGDEGIISSRSV